MSRLEVFEVSTHKGHLKVSTPTESLWPWDVVQAQVQAGSGVDPWGEVTVIPQTTSILSDVQSPGAEEASGSPGAEEASESPPHPWALSSPLGPLKSFW